MHNPANTEGAPIAQDTVKNASDLRDLLRQAELAIANLRRGSSQQAVDLVRTVHVIEKAIPMLEEQFTVELKAERTRLQTLEGALRNNATLLVRKAGRNRLQELRQEVEASEADWWMRLDLLVAEQRSRQLRRLAVRVGAAVVVVVVLAVLYQLFLAPKPDHLQNAESYLSHGQLEKALTEYMTALEAGTGGSEAPLAVGAILTQLGRNNEAEPYLDRARELLPNEADFYASLSLAYYRMASQGGVDAVDKAEEAALAALEADDTSAMAYLALGSVYELQDKIPQAIEALSRASRLSKDDALTASIQVRLAMLSQRPAGLPTMAAEPTQAEQ